MKDFLDKVWEELREHLPLLWESLKEPLREIVLLALPGILAYLQTIPAEWAVILYFSLRAIDSYLHQLGKLKKNDVLVTGLTRF